SPPPAAPEPEPLAETLAPGDVPSWLLEMQPEETSPAAPTPSAAQLPEELSWLEALAEGLPEEASPAAVEPPAQPVVVEPVPPSERPAWLAPTGKLDPSVVERYEQEQAARPAEPPPAPEPEPQPAPPARRVASLQQARQQVVQGQVLPALESYQALIDNMENLEEVRADLRRLVEQHPKEPKVRRLLGDTHMRLGDLQAALDAYLTALKEL
ncbi:MAG: tetratricopeptide repeat protein, partial [Aggregatilineales bacterium]